MVSVTFPISRCRNAELIDLFGDGGRPWRVASSVIPARLLRIRGDFADRGRHLFGRRRHVGQVGGGLFHSRRNGRDVGAHLFRPRPIRSAPCPMPGANRRSSAWKLVMSSVEEEDNTWIPEEISCTIFRRATIHALFGPRQCADPRRHAPEMPPEHL